MIKKEVILAIIIGFALGLLITFGIWTANRSLKQAQINTISASPTPTTSSPTPNPTISTTPPPTPSAQSRLTITSPEDESLVNSNSLTIKGSASPNSVIAIIAENSDQVTQSDSQGNFSADLNLETGFNQIRLTAFTPDGKSESKTIVVTYSTAKI